MGLFSIFKGKDAAGHEASGDRLMDSGDWGPAKLAYEDALAKLDKQFPPPGDAAAIARRLEDKRGQCMESLAREHFEQAEELVDAGYSDEAREYYHLALELAREAAFRERIEARLAATEAGPGLPLADEVHIPSYPLASDPEADFAGDPDEYFEALLSTLPADVSRAYESYGSNFKTGYIALNQGDFATAAAELALALDLNPDRQGYIPLELATALVNLGQGPEARGLLENFLAHQPGNLPAYRLLCEIFWEGSQFEQAGALLESLPADLKLSLDYYQLRGETLMRAGESAEAETLFRGFLADHGWNQEIAVALAGALEAQGDPAAARELYGQLMAQCQGCGARIPIPIKRKFADLGAATGQPAQPLIELYLALAQEDAAQAPHCYRQVSTLYDLLGNRTEAQRFRQIAGSGAQAPGSGGDGN